MVGGRGSLWCLRSGPGAHRHAVRGHHLSPRIRRATRTPPSPGGGLVFFGRAGAHWPAGCSFFWFCCWSINGCPCRSGCGPACARCFRRPACWCWPRRRRAVATWCGLRRCASGPALVMVLMLLVAWGAGWNGAIRMVDPRGRMDLLDRRPLARVHAPGASDAQNNTCGEGRTAFHAPFVRAELPAFLLNASANPARCC